VPPKKLKPPPRKTELGAPSAKKAVRDLRYMSRLFRKLREGIKDPGTDPSHRSVLVRRAERLYEILLKATPPRVLIAQAIRNLSCKPQELAQLKRHIADPSDVVLYTFTLKTRDGDKRLDVKLIVQAAEVWRPGSGKIVAGLINQIAVGIGMKSRNPGVILSELSEWNVTPSKASRKKT